MMNHDVPETSTSNHKSSFTRPPTSGIIRNSSSLGDRKAKSTRFCVDGDAAEITLDVGDDAILVCKSLSEDKALIVSQVEQNKLSSIGKILTRHIRNISRDFRQIASTSNDGRPDKLDRSKSGATRALRGLYFLTKEGGHGDWTKVESRFDALAVDGMLHKSKFGECIGMKESDIFAIEVFNALARRRCITSSSITKPELLSFWEQMNDKSFDGRLQTFFDMVDTNADGRIFKEEVKDIIWMSSSCNKLIKIRERASEYATLIMEELDPRGLGYIELKDLEMLLLQHPGHCATHLSTSDSCILKMIPSKERNPIKRRFRSTAYFIEDHWKRIWVLAVWILICLCLYAWKFVQYRNREVFLDMGYCICHSKGAAETTKFNMALILLPVCRNSITWLRSRTSLARAVPFNDNISFHKVIAFGIAIGTAIHAGAHLMCDIPRLIHSTAAEYAPLEKFYGAKQPGSYWWFLKGIEGWTGIAMIVLMDIAYILALPWFRHNLVNLPRPLRKITGFNAFWYSHHLLVIVYGLFIIHGYFLNLSREWYTKTTWMYLTWPMLLYASERFLRSFRSSHETVQVSKVTVYPGNVMSLRMSKPPGFEYTSGQYIFVNCAAVSPVQWHPFSISSAPGDDYLNIHIRTLGDWTSQLKIAFSRICQPASMEQSGLLRADIAPGQDHHGIPKLFIDGPYGAPAQDYRHYDVLLLVGLGIGATPLISILKDVMNNIKHHEEMEETGQFEHGANENKRKPFATKHAYFYWVTREEGSFEWFRGVMDEVAANDHDGVIELHNYCTSVYEEGDARSALIAMLQSLHLAKSGIDIVSGTRVRTHFSRPNWREVYKQIAIKHPGEKVGVFYCGLRELGGKLKSLSREFSHETTTKFYFHKENF